MAKHLKGTIYVTQQMQEEQGEMHAEVCEPKHLAKPTSVTLSKERDAGAPIWWVDSIFDSRVMRHAR